MPVAPLTFMDFAACAVLAAAASCKGRMCGNHFSGAAVLGCLSGLFAPLVRDVLLGLPAVALNRGGYLASAAFGALAGALVTALPPRIAPWLARYDWKIFYWTDALGLALATGVGTVLGSAFGLTGIGCILVGVLSGLAGGIFRDMALSEPARAVEEDFYATAAFMGAVLTLALLLYVPDANWKAAFAGAALVLVLRFWRRGGSFR